MKLQIRLQSTPGLYQLWIAENDSDWAPVSQGQATAKEVGAAIVDQAARVGWEKLPGNVRIADDQGRPPLRIPREIWPVLDGVFKARDQARKAN